MLLEWMARRHGAPELAKAGEAIERAIDRVLANAATRTRDLGGTLGCEAFADAVVGELA
jgi:3-isopropylmalate dehydrogenase